MPASLSKEELMLCQIYGEQCREFYRGMPWNACVERLQAGWLRIRGECVLCWADAEPYVRDGWHGMLAAEDSELPDMA